MNKQFNFLLLQNIFIGICGMIDTAFGNHLGLDSICVLSAFTVITWCTYSIYSVGHYAYRVTLSDAKLALLIQLVTSVLLCLFVFAFSTKIPYLYSLTDTQYKLFISCLKMHAITIPLSALSEFIYNYMIYQCKNKLVTITNIAYYIGMFLIDTIIVLNKGSLDTLLFGTFLCLLIYDIVVFFGSGIIHEKFEFSIIKLKQLLKYGTDTCIDRITGKIATIVFNVYASKLGTELYAIHAICYTLGTFTENFSNTMLIHYTMRLSTSSVKKKFEYTWQLNKKYIPLSIIYAYITVYILLFFIHGDVDMRKCMVYLVIYAFQIIPVSFYESMKGYLTSEKLTNYLKFGGTVGIFTRIPVVLIGYYSGLGLFTFALASSVDFGFRGLYFYSKSIKHHRELVENSRRKSRR